MTGRKTENVTRVDIRIPNDLYQQISAIALNHFHAKIHHRSQKPEVTPTILELIKIGIAHLESTLPVTQDVTESVTSRVVTERMQQQIELLNSRLTEVENKLSFVSVNAPIAKSPLQSSTEPDSIDTGDEKVLSDMELSDVLNVSNILIRDYRVKGKKPRGSFLAKALTEHWEIKGEGWVKKSQSK